MTATRIDGQFFDIPPAVRCFDRYTSEQRADHAASFRLGFRQRQRVGEYFWIHPFAPNTAFRSRGEALRAALRTLSIEATV